MAVLSKIKSHSDTVDYLKELCLYNKPIEKPKVKHLKNIDRSAELPFYEKLCEIKTDQAFRGYAMAKNLFNDLLNETKGFKYQITVKVLLKNTSSMEKLNLLQFILIQ